MIRFRTDLELPFLTDGYPGIGGRLRVRPEDFDVEEIPLYEASGYGEHLFVNITRVQLTTKEMQAGLARLFGLKRSQIGFAGLKDKRARTSQTFSIGVGLQEASFADEAASRIEDQLGIKVNWARFHRNKLKTGHLLGNRFSVLVSEPDCDPQRCFAQCNVISSVIRTRGIPNCFGPQRFGRDGNNVQQGLDLLRGDLSRRDKWLRRFLVGSVQSYLCNWYLAERLRSGMFDRLIGGDVAKKYETGGMFVVENVSAEQPRYAAHEISFTAPVFGPKMWPAKAESGEFETGILERAGLTTEDFGRVRVSGTRRLGRLLIADLEVLQDSYGILLRFSLPKGAYATTVLREFMKNEGETGVSDDDATEYGNEI
jgi:tRNA pseudouridine13 synthase